MYTVKRLSLRAGLCQDAAPDFSQTFVGYVERYGRSFELGLAARYHLTHSPLKKIGHGPLAVGLFLKDRLAVRPHKIRGLRQLQAVLERAKALEGA
jgi:hypothetical protein